MRNIIIVGTGAILLNSCSLFRHTKTTEIVNVDRYRHSTVETSSVIDTGMTSIVEESDSSFYSPEVKLSKSFVADKSALLFGLANGLFNLESPLMEISLHYDSIAGKLNVAATKKPEQGSVKKKKTTNVKNGVSQAESKKQVKEKEVTQSLKKVEQKPGWLDWIFWIATALNTFYFLRSVWPYLKRLFSNFFIFKA